MTIHSEMNHQAASVRDLKPAPYNPRSITKDRHNMLLQSLETFGDLSGVVFNTRTGQLVGGHQRVRLMERRYPIEKQPWSDGLGTVAVGHILTPFGKVPYREVDWDMDKEKAANIAANKHGGDFDHEKLKDILEELDTGDIDMETLGFSGAELENLMTWTGGANPQQELEAAEALLHQSPPEARAEHRPPPEPPKPKVPGVVQNELPPDPVTLPPKLPPKPKSQNHLEPADPPTTRALINHNLIFDNKDQFEYWQKFMLRLRQLYPSKDTLADRLMEYIHAHSPEISDL